MYKYTNSTYLVDKSLSGIETISDGAGTIISQGTVTAINLSISGSITVPDNSIPISAIIGDSATQAGLQAAINTLNSQVATINADLSQFSFDNDSGLVVNENFIANNGFSAKDAIFTNMPVVGGEALITAKTVSDTYVTKSTYSTLSSTVSTLSTAQTSLSSTVSTLSTSQSNLSSTVGTVSSSLSTLRSTVSTLSTGQTSLSSTVTTVSNFLNTFYTTNTEFFDYTSDTGLIITQNAVTQSISAQGYVNLFQGAQVVGGLTVDSLNNIPSSKIHYLVNVSSDIQAQINGAYAAASGASAGAAGAGAAAALAQTTATAAATAAAAAQASADAAAASAKSANDNANSAHTAASNVQTNLNNVIDQHCAHFSSTAASQTERTYCGGLFNVIPGTQNTDAEFYVGSSPDTWTTQILASTGTVVSSGFKIGNMVTEALGSLVTSPLTIDKNGNITTITGNVTCGNVTATGNISGGNLISTGVTTSVTLKCVDIVAGKTTFKVDNYGNITNTGNIYTNNIISTNIAATGGISCSNFGVYNPATPAVPQCRIDLNGNISTNGMITATSGIQITNGSNIIKSNGINTVIGDIGSTVQIFGKLITYDVLETALTVDKIYQGQNENISMSMLEAVNYKPS